jgi:hypothetical protein
MRATGQASSLTVRLQEDERRLVLARAMLGEWLGGSGGGWQDSGGVWPGMKLIEGVLAGEGDPEFGISRGRLMPSIAFSTTNDASPETLPAGLQDSLVLVHGGMAQNVGPILEMVTRNICSAPMPNGRPASRPSAFWTKSSPALKRDGRAALGAADHAQFLWADPDHHSVGQQFFTESLINRAEGVREGFLGLLDAGRHVGRRHGFHF